MFPMLQSLPAGKMVIDNIHTANSITRAVGSLVIDSFSKTGHKKGKGTLEEVPLP